MKKIATLLIVTFKGRIQSFRHAFVGMGILFTSQANAKIHLCAAGTAILAGFCVDLSSSQWCWIVTAIVIVWCAEALNTAIERLADAAVPKVDPLVKQAKDVAAAAVLMAALGAVIIGMLIFGPHLALLLKR